MEENKKIDVSSGSRIKFLCDIPGKNGVAYKEGDETHAEHWGMFHLWHEERDAEKAAVRDPTNPGFLVPRPLGFSCFVVVKKYDDAGKWY